jgi:hypothetical protein
MEKHLQKVRIRRSPFEMATHDYDVNYKSVEQLAYEHEQSELQQHYGQNSLRNYDA